MIHQIKTLIRDKLPIAMPVAIAIRHKKSMRKIRRLVRERRDIWIELGAGNKSGKGDGLPSIWQRSAKSTGISGEDFRSQTTASSGYIHPIFSSTFRSRKRNGLLTSASGRWCRAVTSRSVFPTRNFILTPTPRVIFRMQRLSSPMSLPIITRH